MPSYKRAHAGPLSLIVLSVAALVTFADEPAHLSADQAAKDAKTFIQLLEDTHPDPYSNLGGKIAFKRKAQELIQSIPSQGLSAPELTDKFAAFLAPLKDGHTNVRGARERWQDAAPRLAVEFRIMSDGLLLAGSDLPELKGTRGDKLIAVNGHSVDELVNKFSNEIATENIYGTYTGVIMALRSAKLLHNLIPDLDRAQPFTYTLLQPDGTEVRRSAHWGGEHSEDPAQWSEKPLLWTEFDRSSDPFYFRFIGDGSTAYFRVANMMPREGYEVIKRYHVGNLHDFLEQYYKRIRKPMPQDLDVALLGVPSLFEQGTALLNEMKRRSTPNLIIDLRENGGGSTPVIVPFFYQLYGDAYFGRQSKAEFVQVKSKLWMEKYNTTVEAERKKHPNFEVGEYEFSGPEPGTAEEKRNKKLSEWAKLGFSFSPAIANLNGRPLYTPTRVVVLCDPGTFSAAFQAAFILHEMRATLVGVPPAQSPNAFMEATPFVLPESGIHGNISNGMQMYMPDDPRANVLHPDHETSYSVFKRYDFDEDTALRYALDLLKNGKL